MELSAASLGPAIRHWLICFFAVLAGLALPASAQTQTGAAVILQVEGAIGPASASYITEGLESAREADAELVVLQMDTPGGLDSSMREIIRKILEVPVPVVSYVHPSGARAASAGTFILYASHVAAMTPGTNLGAATPVQIGGSPASPDGDNGEAAPAATASERKAVNDAVAYIRSLADMRGRNADWAEDAVREAASLPAGDALEAGVVDLVAEDVPALLQQLDGRVVTIRGADQVLRTADIAVVELHPGWATRLLAIVTDPNVALILLMLGVYGLVFEFMNPGALVPGTIGAIALLVGLYALAALPVDFVGGALILLGIGLMVAEAFVPSFGVLGIGGIAAFVFGATILVDTDVPEFRIDWSVIAALAVFSAGLLVVVVRLAIRAYRERVRTGQDELVGSTGQVLDWHSGAGHVFVHSERWNAVGPDTLAEGSSILVKDIEGLTLSVSPAPERKQEE